MSQGCMRKIIEITEVSDQINQRPTEAVAAGQHREGLWLWGRVIMCYLFRPQASL